jgi:hypothetical protein
MFSRIVAALRLGMSVHVRLRPNSPALAFPGQFCFTPPISLKKLRFHNCLAV